ncbi:heterokaryon incompatibility protein-domain-containing protein [Hyaloscypha finlandica]|nr:heterokaryon incompatibility protein-domain-containing protein [Hyaloscypha sp. PMI_1271]KAH8760045.1 heterokaryon incompatibility protein-domain-containing protein [Hyaloscypha finlandica]
MSEFIYSPIPASGDGFRILRLRPGSPDDSVECDVINARLDSSNLLSYDALSYCWGDPDDRETITVHGREQHVTRNLQAALRQLRSVSRDRLLWADAVCILVN